MKKFELTNSANSDFFNKLGLLITSGVTLCDGLLILADEETDKTYSIFLNQLYDSMDQGSTFAEALELTGVFPKHITGLISVSEQVGHLEETFYSLSRYYDNKEKMNRSIRNSLTYPSILLLVMLIVIVVLLTKVLPIFQDVYASLGGSLTGIAGGLLELGKILNQSLPVISVVLAAAVIIPCVILLIPATSKAAKKLFSKIFGDRGIQRKMNNARFADALSIAFSSGIPLEECIDHAAELLKDNESAYKRICKCQKLVEEGQDLTDALFQCNFLSKSSCNLLAVAIRAGHGDTVMAQIAARMSDEAEDCLENAVSKIEPALVIITSFIVGIILLSVMLPLINIMKAI